MKQKDQRNYRCLICNIIQKIGILVFGICLTYILVSLLLYNTTMMWETPMSLSHTSLAIILALLALILILVSSRLKKRNS